ncbi:microcystin degradation protein MlrC [Candidatus Bathyarchaeota archaeon]|nr:microcystin degradation protein MlrC [Candidatus Bathyarchaeota archaeon]
MTTKFKLGVAGFAHETITFWPGLTTLEDFERTATYGEEVLEKARYTNSCIGGFMEVCEEENIKLLPVCNASGGATETVSDEVYDHYVSKMRKGFKEMEGLIDGVLLNLHGAMATESREDPETDAVREIREVVGYEIPLMVTLDLHANKDKALKDLVTGIFGYHSSPHIDMRNTGKRAAKAMVRTLKGEVSPTMALKKPGVVVPSVFSATTVSPAKDIMDRVHEWEKKEGVIDVTALFGFAWSDVRPLGMGMVAVTDNNPELAREIVEDLSDLAWRKRYELTGRTESSLFNVEAGVKLALDKAGEASKPIIILDHADRSNDTTFVLRELINQRAGNTAFPMLYDPESAKKCVEVGEGEIIELDVGATTGWRDGGKVRVKGEILWVGEGKYIGTGPMRINQEINLGPTGILQVDGIWLQLISRQSSLIDDDPMKQFGYNPKDFDVIVSKSKTHFRAVYEKLGEEILIIDAPGQCPADLSVFNYQNVPEGTYPITTKE